MLPLCSCWICRGVPFFTVILNALDILYQKLEHNENMKHATHPLDRATLAILLRSEGRTFSTFPLGAPHLDAALKGGLECAALHEVIADAAHPASAIGFGLALAACAAQKGGGSVPDDHESGRTPDRALGRGFCGGSGRVIGREVVWVRQRAAAEETGGAYGPGLVAFGVHPERVTLVMPRTTIDLLRIGVEAVRCGAIGAVLLETADTGTKIELTATRRLVLAAEKSGVTVLLVRIAPTEVPTAARTRWLVRPYARGGQPCDGPEHPRFDITLLRHRAGIPEMRWQVEWNRDRGAFEEAVSQPVVPVPVGGCLAA